VRVTDDWAAPGSYEVAPGVHRIPLPLPNDGLRAVNVYALLGSGSLVLVDGGWAIPEASIALAAALSSLGCEPADVEGVLVTHVHRDHYTHAVALRNSYGTRVSLGAGERPSLEAIQRPGSAPFASRIDLLRRCGAEAIASKISASAGRDSLDRSVWASPDRWLEGGEAVVASGRRLEVLETPGHTRGHVVFRDEGAGLLFAGDHVLPTITPSIGLEPVLSENPLASYLASLARVRALPDALLLPAHGPVAPSVHARIDELVDHHGRRLDETLAAASTGADSAFEVARQLRWTRRERAFEDLDLFNQMLAVNETLAHLDLLVSQGRLRRVVEDGIDRYVA
jgi:glyoxylase-like metal-dependent hydrolase (beta-lactamase superfamily II)